MVNFSEKLMQSMAILQNKYCLDEIDYENGKLVGQEKLSSRVNISRDKKTATIKLSCGRETIIDTDFLWLARERWCFYYQTANSKIGSAGRKGRAGSNEPKTVLMHRLILKAPKHVIIDHINGNPLDNRLDNLRFAKTQTNAFNKKMPDVPCTSKFKGVFMRGTDTNIWTARIKLSNRIVELGRYADEIEAAMAYNEAAKILFGEYARLNNVPDPPVRLKLKIFEKCRLRIPEAALIVSNSINGEVAANE